MRVFFYLSLFFWLVPGVLFCEELKVTTYYPSPYGVYNELRTKKFAVGADYYNSTAYPIPNYSYDTLDAMIQGNTAIGTTSSVAVSAYYPAALNVNSTTDGVYGFNVDSKYSGLSVALGKSDWYNQIGLYLLSSNDATYNDTDTDKTIGIYADIQRVNSVSQGMYVHTYTDGSKGTGGVMWDPNLGTGAGSSVGAEFQLELNNWDASKKAYGIFSSVSSHPTSGGWYVGGSNVYSGFFKWAPVGIESSYLELNWPGCSSGVANSCGGTTGIQFKGNNFFYISMDGIDHRGDGSGMQTFGVAAPWDGQPKLDAAIAAYGSCPGSSGCAGSPPVAPTPPTPPATPEDPSDPASAAEWAAYYAADTNYNTVEVPAYYFATHNYKSPFARQIRMFHTGIENPVGSPYNIETGYIETLFGDIRLQAASGLVTTPDNVSIESSLTVGGVVDVAYSVTAKGGVTVGDPSGSSGYAVFTADQGGSLSLNANNGFAQASGTSTWDGDAVPYIDFHTEHGAGTNTRLIAGRYTTRPCVYDAGAGTCAPKSNGDFSIITSLPQSNLLYLPQTYVDANMTVAGDLKVTGSANANAFTTAHWSLHEEGNYFILRSDNSLGGTDNRVAIPLNCGIVDLSDKMLKNVISAAPEISPIDRLMRLTTKRYTWNNVLPQDSYEHFGFIAQEVQKIFPEFVHKTGLGEKGYLGIDYQSLFTVSIAAIQDNQKRIESLEKDNAQMKKEIAEIKAALKKK